MVGQAQNKMSSSAKSEMLERIRIALGRNEAFPGAEYDAIPRRYRMSGDRDIAGRIDLFESRLHDYNAGVYRCRASEIAQVIAAALTDRSKSRLALPSGLPREWLPLGREFLSDSATNADLDASDGVVTACAVAIAETGTIVLHHTSGEGRRALTLIPDYHLCVVRASQIVETVPEGVAQMALLTPALFTTISGPSATSDIEMVRIKGVHGPRTLDVVIVID